MASVAKKPFNDPDWIFETKLDGYRAIAVIDSTGRDRLWSRNRLRLEPKFPTLRDAVEELSLRSTILDGEVVALDEEGIPRFQLLQKWLKRPTAPVVYVLFDLLWDNGRDLTGKSVIQRQERLQEIITPVVGIQIGGYLEKRGTELFRLAKEKGLEGIIAKRKRSTYQPGRRSPDWLKIKARPQQEFVVCGFTEGKGSRFKNFGALLLAGYQDGKLRYFGHSGSGFSERITGDNGAIEAAIHGQGRRYGISPRSLNGFNGCNQNSSARWRLPNGPKTESSGRRRFWGGGTIRAQNK